MQTQEQPQHSKEEKEISRNAITAVVIVLSFIGVFMYELAGMSENLSQAEKAKKAKSDEAYFFQGGSFICSSSPMLTSAIYLVSKKNGWEIYDTKYFKKEDLLMTFMSCSRTTEQ
ncbi:MAG: hypothetical protein PHH41_01120 [Sulfurimonas sp.]|nr:hypothetical protein [Sulfurimonas sp.]